MARPRFIVLRAAGTNCENETAWALESGGAAAEILHLGRLLAEPAALTRAQGLVIPGGFSYGDDIAAGRILANRLRTGLGEELTGLVARGGLVLGICNGFQVLVKAGLLPGRYQPRLVQEVSLTWNDCNQYVCRWTRLACQESRCLFLPPAGTLLELPVAHAEGKLILDRPGAEKELDREGLVALRYVAPDGTLPAPRPWNPNGSTADIAGLTDPTGRVLGLMPHPERAMLPWHHPAGRGGCGMEIFRRMAALLA